MSDEDALLAGIAANPTAALPRLVYADWLDDRGDPRAELVRLEAHLVATPGDDAALVRFRDLAAGCDPRWLARVVRPVVARCGLRFDFACPKKWHELTPASSSVLRRCDECSQPVFLCIDRAEAIRRANQGMCVAVDSRLIDPGDLPPRLPPPPLLMGRIRATPPRMPRTP